MRALIAVGLLLSGCDPSVMIGAPNDAGTDAGVPDAGNPGPQIVGGCPRVRLGRATEVTFSADTSALPNLVNSTRLEWREAPDDALEFTAAETGNYVIELASPNSNLGASAQEYHSTGPLTPFTSAACPPSGLVVAIDGFYSHNQPNYPIALMADQTIVIFISAPYWAAVKTGTYTVAVKKVP